MAVQYSPLPEFQAPNINLLGAYAQGQALQQNALQQQRLEQQMKLAELAAGYTANKDLREASKYQTEERVKLQELKDKILEHAKAQLQNIPEGDDNTYQAVISQYKDMLPEEYAIASKMKWDADTRRRMLLTPEQQYKQSTKDVILPSGESQTMRYPEFGGGDAVPVKGLKSAGEWDPIKGSNDTIIGYKSKYGAKVVSPEEFDTMSYIAGREGTGKNPRSSAQGYGQFTDGTFVDTFRKTFPDRAQNMSREQILAQRGATVNGTPIEQPMLQTFTTNNQQKLQDAGFAPTKGNTYLSHFLGANGAIDVLSASPDTPVSEILSPRAIRDNPEVFAKAKTAGDLIKWAGGGPLEPARMKPVGTPARATQDAALNILGDIDINENGGDRVSDLINASTSGAIQTGLSELPRLAGGTTPGREAISQLDVLASEYSLEKLGNKLGGNVSDNDVKFISKTMGDIANPLIPAPERLKAWQEVKRRLAKYADVKLPNAPKPRGVAGETPTKTASAIKRRGTYNGRPVVEYDDGTVAYAD